MLTALGFALVYVGGAVVVWWLVRVVHDIEEG